MIDRLHWTRLLAFVTGLVNQELLLRNEYLTAENRILRAHLPTRLRLSDAERSTLAEIAKRLGRKALQDIARVAKPDSRQHPPSGQYASSTREESQTAEELIDFCKSRLARFKVPKSVVFASALPKTATGKLKKYLLRQTG